MKRMSLPDLSIRQLAPGDEKILKDLMGQFRPKEEADLLVLQSLLSRPDHVYLAALLRQKPVGWAIGYILPRFTRNELYLYEIDVAVPIQRQGVATALIGALQDLARERDISEIFVVTEGENWPAKGLYAGSGGKPSAGPCTMYTWDLE